MPVRKPLVFSFVKEQRIFLIALLALLSFLAVLCLGLVISLGSAVVRWNAQWDRQATIQIMPGGDKSATQKIIENARNDIASLREISESESARMLRPWLSASDAISRYIPIMFEVKFKSKTALSDMGKKIAGLNNVKFVTFADGMRSATSAGWHIMALSVFILALVLGAIVLCISYIARNITLIHKRELEILNQIGARNSFVARQLMIIIARLSAIGAGAGFAVAAPVILIIVGMARNLRVGMFTQMAVPGGGWIALCALVAGIVVLSVWTARRTVMKILRK
ncbi:MAG: hypothetical protein LBK26_03920 [Rickettsiales bacterium]|jgi:cell division transport system permease protein|nr:hypothetical protein [Rickettsiales bacterium]